MNYTEALEYIERGFFGGTRPGLERVSELLGKLGDPQDGLRFIHVAGTNGKGSFCAMTDSVLREAGYHTGLYTSPYIERFNERIVIDGSPISDEELAEITDYVRPFADSMEDRPTEFELITAIAMVCFARHGVDPVVLEVGMGGRLDATNIIKTPVLSVITGISLDHTAILGPTDAAIAREKAGIIKPGVPVIWGGSSPSAGKVIKKVASEMGAPLVRVRDRRLTVLETSLERTVLRYAGVTAELSLLGSYQPRNAANVIRAVGELRRAGFGISDAQLLVGLKKARWKARFEKLSDDPLIISDGSHNPEGIAAAVQGIKNCLGGRKVILMTGVMKDKDYPAMAAVLSEVADRVFTLAPSDTPRALDPGLYAEEFERLGIPAEGSGSVYEAAGKAVEASGRTGLPIVSLGSLYIYREVRAAFEKLLPGKLNGE